MNTKKTPRRIFCIIGLILLLAISACGKNEPGQNESGKPADTSAETELSASPESVGTKQKPAENDSDSAISLTACPSRSGALHVEGTHLVGENGETVQLRGISTHGIGWFPQYINEDCFRQFRDEWGANVVRLAMYTAESGGYCTDGNQEDLKDLVRKGVSYATDCNLYVIVDWHILSDQDPNRYRAEAVDFFREMSAEFADHNNVLYEICNEPNGGTSWTQIKDYAEEVIGVIRKNDADAVIITGTPNWSQYVDEAAADPITDDDNIMYALHFYAATHKDDLRQKMTAAIDAGLPVFVTEYGICDASGSGAIDEAEAQRWIDALDEHNVSYVAWNLSNKNETSAILSPACGKDHDFSPDDLSSSGQWLYRMLTARAGLKTDPAVSEKEPEQAFDSESQQTFTDNGMEVTVQMVNSWESGGKQFRQYSVTLKNISGAAVSGWNVRIPFDETIRLQDGWNGEYAIKGTTLTISAKDYNKDVENGAYVTDVGFIVSAD